MAEPGPKRRGGRPFSKVDGSDRAVYRPVVAEAIRISRGVRIPENAISWRAVRASGPGGQNVNKVASKVELRVDLSGITGLDDAARTRLESLTAGRRDSRGRLLVTSQRTRDQTRNLEDARDKVRSLVGRALVAPKRRRSTRPSFSSVEKRLQHKRLQGERKLNRRPPRADES
jgi:ribosome-associated protein